MDEVLFYYNIRKTARSNARVVWRARKRVSRAFSVHVDNGKQVEPAVCPAELLDLSLIKVKKQHAQAVRTFFKDRFMSTVFEVVEIVPEEIKAIN